MTTLTVLPFLLAFFVGVAAMPTNVYQVCAWNAGTLEIEPWRTRTSAIAARVRSVWAWLTGIGRTRAFRVTAAVALALLAAHAADAHGSHTAVIGVAGIVAEPTLGEVKTAIEASNRLFEEFKQENNRRLKQIEEKGVADPLIQQKLDTLNQAIDAQSKINEAFADLQAKFNRLEKSDDNGKDAKALAADVKSFNLALKSHAQAIGRQQPVEIGLDEYRAYREAEEVYLRRGDRALTPEQAKALSVGSDLNGGFMVSPDKGGRMISRIFETSPMRQYASIQAISTDALEGTVDLDEATVGWVSELGARTDSTTPQVPVPWRIPVHEIYSQPKASQKLVEDATTDIAAWLGKKVGDKIGRTWNTAFVTGNGVGKPRGFASYSTAATADGSRAWGVFEHVATGTSGGFGTDPNAINKLLDLIHAAKDVYAGAGAAFYMNRTTLGKARQLTDASSAGKYVFIPSFQAGLPDTFMGYPARKLQDMATYSTADALAVAFGDMGETYQIVDRLGVSVLVDPFTAKPYIVYYTRARVGGDVINFESLKFLKFGTS